MCLAKIEETYKNHKSALKLKVFHRQKKTFWLRKNNEKTIIKIFIVHLLFFFELCALIAKAFE